MRTMATVAIMALILTSGFWFTPDQQGQRYFRKGQYVQAAEAFHDPMWQGTAWYRAGEFKQAAQSFARRDSAEAHYNRGNALLMHGDYDGAIASYEKALEKRREWNEAIENQNLAKARAKLTDTSGGDLGDQRIGADKVVFDSKKNEQGQETEIAGGDALSDQQIQALWLRRVQTRPADFLKAKFAYQLTLDDEAKE